MPLGNMRRPPDKDGTITDRDVDSSNATLNALFGGSRQKSWMVQSSGIRPTPRTVIPKTIVPQVQATESAAVFISPVSSTYPSPVQSHASIPRNSVTDSIRRVPNDENRRPVRNQAHVQTAGLHPVQKFEGNLLGIQVSSSPTAQTSVLTDGASRSIVEQVGIRRPSEPQQSPNPNGHTLSQAQARSQSTSQNPSLGQGSIPSPAGTLQSVDQQASGPELHTQGPSPALSSASLGSRSTFIPQPPPAQYQIRRPRGRPSHPSKRIRIQVPTMPSLQPRVALIGAHIASAGGPAYLNNGLERPRFQLLADACNNEDVFYVALHQLFCAWDHNRSEVMSLSILPPGNMVLAFRIVGQLIRDNEGLAPTHLKWFTQFPSPLGDLIKTSAPYCQALNDVGNFLVKLTTDWGQFSTYCSSRGYPPLVDEMINILGLLSPVLQQVVFTAARRNLGIVDDRLGTEMEAYFLQDKSGHQELAARYNTARPPTEHEVFQRNQLLVDKYLHVYSQLQQRLLRRQSSHSATGSSLPQLHTLPSNDVNIPQEHRRHSSHHGAGNPVPQPFVLSSNGVNSPLAPHPLSMEPTRDLNFPGAPGNDGPNYAVNAVGAQLPRQQGQQIQPRVQQVQPQSQHVASSQQVPVQEAYLQNGGPLNLPFHQGQEQRFRFARVAQPTNPQPHAQSRMQSHNPAVLQQPISSGNRSANSFNRSIQQPNNIAPRPPQAIDNMNNLNPSGRPSGPSSSSNVPPTLSPNIVAYGEKVQNKDLNRPLIPPTGYTYPPQAPNPDITALHQSPLRSPQVVVKNPVDRRQKRFFQSVADFALGPHIFPRDAKVHSYDVRLPIGRSFARDEPSKNGRLYRRCILDHLQLRLRFIQPKGDATKHLAEENWVLAETKWPETIYVEFNGKHLEVRRKEHHKKDMPIDLTNFITPSAITIDSWMINKIRLSVPKQSDKGFSYCFSVEIIEFKAHEYFKEFIYVPAMTILADVTKKEFMQALFAPSNQENGEDGDGDDDLAVVTNIVGLKDPFSKQLFDIPVRGRHCKHPECFDLATFLESRQTTGDHPGAPSLIDVWKCPLCGLDARPMSLRLVEYLLNVRKTLKERNMEWVKSIKIKPDGSWVPHNEKEPEKRTNEKGLKNYDSGSEDDSNPAQTINRRSSAYGHINGQNYVQNTGGARRPSNNGSINGAGGRNTGRQNSGRVQKRQSGGRSNAEIEVIVLDD